MAAKLSPEMVLAKTLAAPFTPRSQGNPFSCRRLPEGGMVVVAADGRKLWFSAEEVAQVELDLEQQNQHAATRKGAPVKLVPLPEEPARQNNGIPLRAVIHKNQMGNP